MMTKKFYVASAFFWFCVLQFALIVPFSLAQPVSSPELISNAKLYNGKTVVYEGEVIGDVMVRGDYAWVNLNDGFNAIGIWCPKSLTTDIIYKGSYKYRGDRLEVTGVFWRSCPEHGGDLDIHAQAIRKTGTGCALTERLDVSKRNLFLAFAGILCLILILKQLKRAWIRK
ncbi:MAG: DNA-binding protein [Candidatus Omnitrophica bacterium]|nr:DNA-binding protein [Candidatus Omnitrophota bacterium]